VTTDGLIAGRYRIIKLLAAGGMGEVFLAENVPAGRREVLKVLVRRLASEDRFVARFRREARATERLQHPNIVAVLGSGEMADGRQFLALEYVEGDTLEEVLARESPLPLPIAVGYIDQLADAIGYGHACGVVHRDIKPGNLIRLEHRRDTILVLDFGLAKILAYDVDGGESLITPLGVTLGTPPYMAPEQLTGGAIGPWTDVYAIGCVAFELLAGRPPFAGDTMEVMRQQVMEPPPTLRSLRRGDEVPSTLEAVVMQCLQKDPARRPADASAVVDQLRGMRTLVGNERPFDDARTLRDPVQAGVAVRASSSDERSNDPYHRALCALASALVDCGDTDPDLMLALADAGDHEAQMMRVDTALRGARHRGLGRAELADLESALAERRAALAAVQGELDQLVGRRATAWAHEPMVARLVGELTLARKRRMLE
jgi:serine/threonine protein kinase